MESQLCGPTAHGRVGFLGGHGGARIHGGTKGIIRSQKKPGGPRRSQGKQEGASRNQGSQRPAPASSCYLLFLAYRGSAWLLLKLLAPPETPEIPGFQLHILAPPEVPGLLLAPPGSPWLPLAPFGSSWLLLASPGSSWLLLAPSGSLWLLGGKAMPTKK